MIETRRCRRQGTTPTGLRGNTLQARVSCTSTQHVLRRLPHRHRRRRRARDLPRLRQGARSVRARDPRALGLVFSRDPSARLAHRRAARGGGRRDPRARPRARGAVLPRAQRRQRGQGRANHRHHHRCVPNANGPPRGRLPVVIPRGGADVARERETARRALARARLSRKTLPLSAPDPSYDFDAPSSLRFRQVS